MTFEPPNVEQRNRQALLAAIPIRVKNNVVNASIAAFLLIYFGFFSLLLIVPETLADHAWNAFVRVVQVGGIVSALAAILCTTGRLFALAFDGITSILIGLAMVVCLLLQFSDGVSILYLLFAALFVASGFRDTKDFVQYSRLVADSSGPSPPTPPTAGVTAPLSPQPDGDVGHQGREISEYATTPIIERPPAPVAVETPPPDPPAPEPIPDPQPEPARDEPAPDGFLASFAPDDDENDDDKR